MAKRPGIILPLLCVLALGSPRAMAETLRVEANEGGLQAALVAAQPGDRLVLGAGRHTGPIVIEKSIELSGEEGAIVQGNDSGSVISVAAPDVTLRNLEITGSGISYETKDSGVFLGKEAKRARVMDNLISGNLVGVYLWGADDAEVTGNTILGRTDLRMNERGNGVYIWNAPGARIANNTITGGRDGIFVNTSKKNLFEGNRFENLRFAVHYMYTNDSVVRDNISTGNHMGYALMFSKGMTVTGNLSVGDRDHGILLNYANRSTFEANKVLDGGGKCVFIYNSNKNLFRRNWFEGCDIGVHFTGGSERNSITEGAFIGNRTQVKYVGTRWVEWSSEGRGNFWSDNPAYDLDGDGIADAPYKPNDMVDQVMWRYPTAKLLLTSPSVRVLRWAQGQFPALHPGGVIDSAPLMEPPVLAFTIREDAE